LNWRRYCFVCTSFLLGPSPTGDSVTLNSPIPSPSCTVKCVYIFLFSCSLRRTSSLNHMCTSFHSSSFLRPFVSFPLPSQPLDPDTMEQPSTSLSSPSLRSSPNQDDFTLAESILATKGSVYCAWPSPLFLPGNGQVLHFPDEPCLCAGWTAENPDRY
jgi:hypothetical protein